MLADNFDITEILQNKTCKITVKLITSVGAVVTGVTAPTIMIYNKKISYPKSYIGNWVEINPSSFPGYYTLSLSNIDTDVLGFMYVSVKSLTSKACMYYFNIVKHSNTDCYVASDIVRQVLRNNYNSYSSLNKLKILADDGYSDLYSDLLLDNNFNNNSSYVFDRIPQNNTYLSLPKPISDGYGIDNYIPIDGYTYMCYRFNESIDSTLLYNSIGQKNIPLNKSVCVPSLCNASGLFSGGINVGGTGTGVTSDYLADETINNNLFSVSCWIKPRSISASISNIIFRRCDQADSAAGSTFMLGYNQGNLEALIRGSGTNYVVTVYPGQTGITAGYFLSYTPLNEWSLISVTFSIPTMKFYVNGKQIFSTITADGGASLSGSTGSFLLTGIWSIGRNYNDSLQFDGLIDDVRIDSNIARSEAYYTNMHRFGLGRA